MENFEATNEITAEEKSKIQNASVAALVLGIAGIVFPPFALITGIIALIFAKKAKRLNGGLNNGLTTAGIICAIFSIIFGAVIALFIIIYLLICLIPLVVFFLGGM